MSQFDASLLSEEISSNVASHLKFRPLELGDYDKGYLDTLSLLTTVGTISQEQFAERFHWLKTRNTEYFCVVVEDTTRNRVVGSGNLLIERKFIHECGSVGHIEDIVVDESMRGQSIGKWIIKQLVHIGQQKGAYKILLSCLEKNRGFYEKCGFHQKELAMAYYF